MSLSGIFSSRYQRRSFLVASTLVIAACGVLIMLIAYYGKDQALWEAFNNYFISIVASGAFAIISTLYLSYFTDPRLARAETLILPQDIDENLRRLAGGAHDYRIYVRTGRHFRAKALPTLVKHVGSPFAWTLFCWISGILRFADDTPNFGSQRPLTTIYGAESTLSTRCLRRSLLLPKP